MHLSKFDAKVSKPNFSKYLIALFFAKLVFFASIIFFTISNFLIVIQMYCFYFILPVKKMLKFTMFFRLQSFLFFQLFLLRFPLTLLYLCSKVIRLNSLYHRRNNLLMF